MARMRSRDTRIAVVLVNWNGADDTLATLCSLRGAVAWPVDVVVVDNGSSDDSVSRLEAALAEHPHARLVRSSENLGFAGGNVLGLRAALNDPEVGFVLLLNTDVELEDGFLEPLVSACLDPTVGAVGPKILYADPADRIWAAGGRLRLRETVTVELGKDQRDGPAWSQARDVTYLTTCCLLVPRDSLERVGLPDPVFFLNVEDADWCKRALDSGFRLRYVPESRIRHKVASSTGGGYTPVKTFHTARSNALFVRRHHGWLGLLCFVLSNLGALPAAWLRELPRGNTAAVRSKARGLWRGLRDPLTEPPGLAVAGEDVRA